MATANTTTYRGIELMDLDKKVHQSHSRFLEANEGTDWLEALLNFNKQALTPEQFHTVSALSSVASMNYQICNGGLIQYFQNSYHIYHEPFDEQDTERLDKGEQEKMLRTLVEFAIEVFPERAADTAKLAMVAADFAASDYDEDAWDDEEEDFWAEGCLFAPAGFDDLIPTKRFAA